MGLILRRETALAAAAAYESMFAASDGTIPANSGLTTVYHSKSFLWLTEKLWKKLYCIASPTCCYKRPNCCI